jgi:hypothetical protein
MTKEKQELLYNEFKEFFDPEEGGERYPLPMFGVECGDGWFQPLKSLLKFIKNHIEWRRDSAKRNGSPDPYPVPFKVHQIKEKFGGLRFYTNYGDDAIFAAIDMAEAWCWHTCEDCGSNQEVTTDVSKTSSWIMTLCASCRKKLDASREAMGLAKSGEAVGVESKDVT